MKKLIFIIVAILSFAFNASADSSCTVYGGTQGNRVTLETTSVRQSSGLYKVFLSKPEKKDVYVNVRVTNTDTGESNVVQVRIPKGSTVGEFNGSIDGRVANYTFNIDNSSCR